MSATLGIAAVSRRSGFAAPTLRYYEQVGLLPPPERTPAGYRAYDESVFERLAFIARAKALGCSLEEIGGLLAEWERGECAPLQERLRAVAVAKVEHAQGRIADLLASTARLRNVVHGLEGHTADGPCDEDCGCLTEPRPAPATVACTLDPVQMARRIGDWQGLLGFVTARRAVSGGVRLELADGTPLDELARLVAAERSCCAFFAFAITVDDRGVGLEVRAPAEASTVVTALFGRATTTA